VKEPPNPILLVTVMPARATGGLGGGYGPSYVRDDREATEDVRVPAGVVSYTSVPTHAAAPSICASY